MHIVHDWWQKAPIVSHYLHLSEYKTWPGPWDLLADNNYCELAKAAGIMYTIILLERKEIYSLNLLQTDNYTYVQVLTDGGEYILNNISASIKSDLSGVCILHTLNCNYFIDKLL